MGIWADWGLIRGSKEVGGLKKKSFFPLFLIQLPMLFLRIHEKPTRCVNWAWYSLFLPHFPPSAVWQAVWEFSSASFESSSDANRALSTLGFSLSHRLNLRSWSAKGKCQIAPDSHSWLHLLRTGNAKLWSTCIFLNDEFSWRVFIHLSFYSLKVMQQVTSHPLNGKFNNLAKFLKVIRCIILYS